MAHSTELGDFSGVVALDGPSGTGKSTVARRLADRLNASYLDSGAMYRAATVAVLEAGADLADPDAIAVVVRDIDVWVSTDPQAPATALDGRSVDAEIRSAATTGAVSAVSAVPAVREKLVAQQRALIAEGPIVAEGRDIGSVVWPQAELKVYLTATEEVRARRRAGEVSGGNIAEVAADIRRRDGLDSSRAVSPLRRADGAVVVDTSELSIEQVVSLLERLARAAADTIQTVPSG
ncbi:MAG: (d)CMP kinase [Frankiales bacterium]|nr:(d)CMP kinase [Frankiales bacterium]